MKLRLILLLMGMMSLTKVNATEFNKEIWCPEGKGTESYYLKVDLFYKGETLSKTAIIKKGEWVSFSEGHLKLEIIGGKQYVEELERTGFGMHVGIKYSNEETGEYDFQPFKLLSLQSTSSVMTFNESKELEVQLDQVLKEICAE